MKNLQEIVSRSKSKADGLTYCSAGIGRINQMAAELFKQKTGANLSHVPYRGSGPAVVDLLAGRVDVFFATVPTSFARQGRGCESGRRHGR